MICSTRPTGTPSRIQPCPTSCCGAAPPPPSPAATAIRPAGRAAPRTRLWRGSRLRTSFSKCGRWDMKSGARGSAWHGGPYRPVDLMRKVAANASDADVIAAADYFAAQTLRPRVTVIERARIPRMRVIGWVYALDPHGGHEALGQRLIEWSPDPSRHERRDDIMRYTAFVSPGSVERGRRIATTGQDAGVQACSSCHGAHLQGWKLDTAAGGPLAHVSDAATGGVSRPGTEQGPRPRRCSRLAAKLSARRHDRGGGVRGLSLAARGGRAAQTQAALSAL